MLTNLLTPSARQEQKRSEGFFPRLTSSSFDIANLIVVSDENGFGNTLAAKDSNVILWAESLNG